MALLLNLMVFVILFSGGSAMSRFRESNFGRVAGPESANVVVATDRTGNFSKIMDAVGSCPDHNAKRYIIYIKRGVYAEHVSISAQKINITMIGDGMDATVITGNRSNATGWSTPNSATFSVLGRGFVAINITFENTAGPKGMQAVAYLSGSDFSVLYRCSIRGYQDTLYANGLHQFYRECIITGTIDFIFGNGAAVFQKCDIQVRQALPQQKNTITAQGRTSLKEHSGFSIQFCNISSEPGVSTPTYLGRPWQLYSTTAIMQSYIDSIVVARGWLEWNGSRGLDTLIYGEYNNTGPGARLNGRVEWPGYSVLNDSTARNYTVAKLIAGDSWIPYTGINYMAGLG